MNTVLKFTQADFEAVEKERSKRDAAYFVEEYVHIEDRDQPENIAIKFNLWDKQKSVLADFVVYRLIQILKARQLGLTWLALSYAVWCMVFRCGYSVIALSKTDDDAKELVRRAEFILRHLPVWLVPKWEASKEAITIYHKESSIFQSFPASQNAGRSFTANLVILDEWAFQQWARDIWKAAYPSINRSTGGQVIGLSTVERGTLFEDIWFDKENEFHKIFLPWETDPRRNQEWYEKTKRALKEGVRSEYPATEDEAFSIPGGAFFPEFRRTIHIMPPLVEIPNWYNRYRFLDYGLDMLACYFAYTDNQGLVRIYKEIYEAGLVISQAAYKILKASGAKVPDTIEKWDALSSVEKQTISKTATENFSCTFAPPDLFATSSQTGKASSDVWDENGIYLTKSKNDFEQGCIAISEWLHPLILVDEQTGKTYTTATLTIDQNCAPNLVHALLNIQKDKHNPKVYAKQPHNLTHSVDGLRYFCIELIDSSKYPKEDTRPEWRKRLDKKRQLKKKNIMAA